MATSIFLDEKPVINFEDIVSGVRLKAAVDLEQKWGKPKSKINVIPPPNWSLTGIYFRKSWV